MKVISYIVMKNIFRWLILGVTLFFLAKVLKDNWLEVTAIRIDYVGWAILAIACGITLSAHIWAGWVWTWILRGLNQPVETIYFIQVYLKTNIAKYLPGNIWHYYGRILAAKEAQVSSSAATFSVLLEPLLMLAAALILIICLGNYFTPIHNNSLVRVFQILSLLGLLCAIHPRFLNPLISFLRKLKSKKPSSSETPSNDFYLERYPILPLLGELAFLGLRGSGFILTMFALTPLELNQIPLLLGAFSFSWLLGLIVPGAPGGIGVFEASAIALLDNRFPPALIISTIGLYRLISIIAEIAGAGLAWLDEHLPARR
jgi:glycosyltransferase 2 family protein